MTDTDVALLLYYKTCPYDRHDLYLPSIPASLQTLGRFECAVTSAPAPHGLRIISPLTLTLVFSSTAGAGGGGGKRRSRRAQGKAPAAGQEEEGCPYLIVTLMMPADLVKRVGGGRAGRFETRG